MLKPDQKVICGSCYLLSLWWLSVMSVSLMATPIAMSQEVTQKTRAAVAAAGGDLPILSDVSLRDEVKRKLKLAVQYFREQVATHGGYVYYYQPSLDRRWGEGEASRDQIWVQPPGTPAVGLAFLAAYQATEDGYYLDGVREVAAALLHGQLESGGWRNAIDFDPSGTLVAHYRHGRGTSSSRSNMNRSSLDDGQTQTAIRFLILADEACGFAEPAIHEGVEYGLKRLIAAQFRNGAFPQSWPTHLAPEQFDKATLKASYPKYDWRTEGRVKEYWDLYTLNDDLAVTLTEVWLAAYRVYGEEKYLETLKRLGDFLVAAQMPEPQPAWAQQYTYAMHPAWARKFEPPAISSHESQGVVRALMDIYLATEDERYLAPIQPCLEYLHRSLLPDGRLARYYELETNRPLYMQREGEVYSLTYSDERLPSHYAWKIPSQVELLRRQLAILRKADGVVVEEARARVPEDRIRNILGSLDEHHRWLLTVGTERLVGQPQVKRGEQLISTQLFIDNVLLLCRYLEAEGR